MKILLLNQAFYPDGVATSQHSTDLAKFLVKNGHTVSVVAGNRAYEDRSKKFASYETHQGIHIHRVSSTGFGKKMMAGRIVDALTFQFMLGVRLATLPRQDVTICFTSPPLIGIFGIAFRKLKGGKVIQWLMDVNPETAIAVGILNARSPLTRLLLAIHRWSLHHSDRIVVLDRWCKTRAMNHGVGEKKITIIPPWPVQALSRPKEQVEPQENPFRVKYRLGGKFIVMYSGNHSIVHPLDTLLDAALLLKDRSDIHFVFFGGGLRVKDVTEFVARHGLKNITQLPFQPRELLQTLLDVADLHVVVQGAAVTGLVHPSKIYGVLASGKPYLSISPQESFLYDILRECPYGFHVEHGQPDFIVQRIEAAMRLTPSMVRDYATRNFDYVVSHFSAEKVLARVLTDVLEVPSTTAKKAA